MVFKREYVGCVFIKTNFDTLLKQVKKHAAFLV